MIYDPHMSGLNSTFVALPFSRLHLARGEKDTGADERGGTPSGDPNLYLWAAQPNLDSRIQTGVKLLQEPSRTSETECMTLFLRNRL